MLALIAGYVDCYALITLGVFSSFMSGNTTQGGMYAGESHFLLAGRNLLPIPCFVIGVTVSAFLFSGPVQRALRWRCWLVAALLFVSMFVAYLGPLSLWLNIILLSFAMGVMNTTIDRVGRQSISLGYVSGDLNNLGRNLALAIRRAPLHDAQSATDTAWRRTAILASVWSFFLVGAVLSSVGIHFASKWILVPAIVGLGLLAFVDEEINAKHPNPGTDLTG